MEGEDFLDKDVLSSVDRFEKMIRNKSQDFFDTETIESIAEYIIRLSQLVTDFSEIKELDMNPVKVLEDSQGVIVMDAKAIIEVQHSVVEQKIKSEKEELVA